MKIRKNIICAAIIFVFSSVVFAQTEAARTQFSLYGTHFLSPDQTMRLILQNPRFADSDDATRVRARIVLDFYEAAADGSVRTRPIRRVEREMELDAGEAVSFDFAATLACDGSVCPAVRTGVYVSASVFAVAFHAEMPVEMNRLKFNSTFALREAGRTILSPPAVEKGFDPQPDPPVLSKNRF